MRVDKPVKLLAYIRVHLQQPSRKRERERLHSLENVLIFHITLGVIQDLRRCRVPTHPEMQWENSYTKMTSLKR